MAGTGDIRTGDTVYTLGNPLGLGLSVSSGIISDTSRVVERYDLPCIMDTANISQGSSGGALLNAYGQVIGVTSGAYVYGNGMYLAVPVDPAMTADLTGSGWTLAEVTAIEQAKETADA
jgi:S1-C subfamily serine protease